MLLHWSQFIMLESWPNGYLDAVQAASQQGHQGGKSSNSLLEKTAKSVESKPSFFLVTPKGKGRNKDVPNPAGRSPALKPQQRQWHTSGQGEKPGEDSPAVSNGERARGSQILCSPCGGGRDMPPQWLLQPGARRSHKWFSGSLLIALVRLLMEDKSRNGSWSGLYIVSFLQQGAPCLARSGSGHRTPINNNAIAYVSSIHCIENLPLRVHINLSCWPCEMFFYGQ